jgi:hypothetical protein
VKKQMKNLRGKRKNSQVRSRLRDWQVVPKVRKTKSHVNVEQQPASINELRGL